MTMDELYYCGHRTQKIDCLGCVNYEQCDHCGENLMYEDLFGELWCHQSYWGPKKENL